MACNMHFASDQMGKNPCESVKSVSSVVYEFERIPLLVPHRPRMTLIRRICTDTAPSLAIWLLQASSFRFVLSSILIRFASHES